MVSALIIRLEHRFLVLILILIGSVLIRLLEREWKDEKRNNKSLKLWWFAKELLGTTGFRLHYVFLFHLAMIDKRVEQWAAVEWGILRSVRSPRHPRDLFCQYQKPKQKLVFIFIARQIPSKRTHQQTDIVKIVE